MKVTVLKNNFKEGLFAVERAVAENANLPILKHVLLKTANNKLRVAATNLELAVTTHVPGKIVEEGSIAVPFATLYSIVSNAGSERIDLEAKNNNLLLSTDNYEAKIQGLPESDFPIIPKIQNNENSFQINAGVFKDALNQVAIAAQYSEIRPEISGVLFNIQPHILKLAATDSFRLAEKTLQENQLKVKINNPLKIIVPLKTVSEVVKIFSDGLILDIYIDQNQILFKTDASDLISRLIDGTYPDYEAIVPGSASSELHIEKSQFVQALKLVSSFSSKINDVYLKFHDGQKAIEVFSSHQYLGENNYMIPVRSQGEDFKKVAFNWRYLLDGLKAVKSENLVFWVNGDVKPALLKSLEDASYYYIIMPIKTA